jgi:hypothetical protein
VNLCLVLAALLCTLGLPSQHAANQHAANQHAEDQGARAQR